MFCTRNHAKHLVAPDFHILLVGFWTPFFPARILTLPDLIRPDAVLQLEIADSNTFNFTLYKCIAS